MKKRGQGAGGDPMQMISIILMIVSLAMGLSGQCKKEEKKDMQDIFEPIKNIGPRTTAVQSCKDLGGFFCDPFVETCHGALLPASDNTKNSVCYSRQPEREETQWSILLTCAAQKGIDCGSEQYCPQNNWIIAKDVPTCCLLPCIARVQATGIFPTIGETIIERFDESSFGVWYGGDPQTRAFDAHMGFRAISHPNFARARAIGNNKYEFTVEGKKYLFTIIKNDSAEIAVEVR